ncbi:Arc family DNA-binding protein [Acinetobacter sp. 2JN-4]|uniref:Arc family DNA-binding protein n=1 Tax=Acinetobacter sp. 2JN-4 TaxID=2479844 RepID=UPI000EF9DAEF|nr:Arc family DNA-binding protein [Acinetobacter sp. 2JN-4]RLZ06630.1 Arc family DNA-binding protein [Acinetobacter sp. 2JN-4]
MARNDPQMNLRVPMELKERIEKAALDNGRTITAEAVFRLENSFEQGFDNLKNVPTEGLMKELAKRLDGFSVVVNQK